MLANQRQHRCHCVAGEQQPSENVKLHPPSPIAAIKATIVAFD
jgi:hypothetical protein